MLVFFFFFLAFSLAFVSSYLITERIIPILGLINLLLFIAFHFAGIWFGVKLTFSQKKFFRKTIKLPNNYIYFLLIGFTILAGWGLWKGALHQAASINIMIFLSSSLSNRLRSNIVWGGGYTIVNSLSVVAFIILLNKRKKTLLDYTLIFFNSLIIFLFAFSYSARLKLLILLIVPFIVYSRSKLRSNISTFFLKPKVIFFSLFIFVIIILGGGIRGVGAIAERYTSSSISWTLSTFSDYFISTTLFSIHTLNSPPNEIPDIYTIRVHLGPKDIHGYTNIGRYSSIYKKYGYFGFFIVFAFGAIIGLCWMQYIKGEAVGLLTYPLAYYFLIEGLRIEPFFVKDLFIPFVLLLFLSTIIRKEFFFSSHKV